jgi:hypothetical protein
MTESTIYVLVHMEDQTGYGWQSEIDGVYKSKSHAAAVCQRKQDEADQYDYGCDVAVSYYVAEQKIIFPDVPTELLK